MFVSVCVVGCGFVRMCVYESVVVCVCACLCACVDVCVCVCLCAYWVGCVHGVWLFGCVFVCW